MGLETVNFINDLNAANPAVGVDRKDEGDNHIRNIKAALLASLPGFAGRIWRSVVKTSGPVVPSLQENCTLIKLAVSTTVIPQAGTLGPGWMAILWAHDQASTIDPGSNETVNGQAAVALLAHHTAILISTGVIGEEFICIDLGELGLVGGFEPGTRILFHQPIAPPGWVRETNPVYNDSALRFVTGSWAPLNGASNFTTVFGPGAGTLPVTLTELELPFHRHFIAVTTDLASADHTHDANVPVSQTGGTTGNPAIVMTLDDNLPPQAYVQVNVGNMSANHQHFVPQQASDGTGSGAPHAHSLQMDVKYMDVTIAQKS